MPAWKALKRRELVVALRKCGFSRPFSGGKHEFMLKGDVVLTIPNPHRGDISIGLLKIILRQAGISRQEWERT